MSAVSDGFDTALAGTAEEAWQAHFRTQPAWLPQAERLVVVSPHPDDEVLGAGGLMASYACRHRPVLVISVTDGEGAFADWNGLGSLRRNELNLALRLLGVGEAPVVRLQLPDGRVGSETSHLRTALSKLIEPGVLLVAPYEQDGHPDHDAVGRVCLALAQERQVPIARYPIWTWHQREPRALTHCRWGRFELDAAVRRAKLGAISAFQSQLRPPAGRKPIVPAHLLPYFMRSFEAFIL